MNDTDTNFAHEAQAAMLSAQRLLFKHGLTMADVDGDAVGGGLEAVDEPAGNQARRSPWWHKLMASVVARNFRCYAYLGRYLGMRVKGRSDRMLRNDFILGFLEGLKDQFAAQVAANEWGLALRRHGLVEERIAELKARTKGTARLSASLQGSVEARSAGYRSGQEFGSSVKKSPARRERLTEGSRE